MGGWVVSAVQHKFMFFRASPTNADRAHLYPNEQMGQADNNEHSNDNWSSLVVLMAADIIVYGEVGAHHCPQELGGSQEDVDVEQDSHPPSWLFVTQRTLGTVLCQQHLKNKYMKNICLKSRV